MTTVQLAQQSTSVSLHAEQRKCSCGAATTSSRRSPWRGAPLCPPQGRACRGADRRLGASSSSIQSATGAALPAAPAAAEGPDTVAGFCCQQATPLGQLTIRAAAAADVGPASVLLTRAFAGSLQGIPIQDARQYCLDSLKQVPRGVLLVARLQPDDPALLPPGQASRVVATTGLSFCRATREDFPTLQPPDEAVYLSNMAVDGKLRRYGFARLMLAAAEGLAAAQGGRQLYLHARLADAPAQQLYLSSGYAVVGRDGFLAKLRGITPRALMVKPLQ